MSAVSPFETLALVIHNSKAAVHLCLHVLCLDWPYLFFCEKFLIRKLRKFLNGLNSHKSICIIN